MAVRPAGRPSPGCFWAASGPEACTELPPSGGGGWGEAGTLLVLEAGPGLGQGWRASEGKPAGEGSCVLLGIRWVERFPHSSPQKERGLRWPPQEPTAQRPLQALLRLQALLGQPALRRRSRWRRPPHLPLPSGPSPTPMHPRAQWPGAAQASLARSWTQGPLPAHSLGVVLDSSLGAEGLGEARRLRGFASLRPGQRPGGTWLAWPEMDTGLDLEPPGGEGNSRPSCKHGCVGRP